MTLYRGSNGGQRVIMIKVEGTEGTDASPGAADVVKLQEFAMGNDSEPLPDTPVSAEQPGTPDLQTSVHVKPAGQKRITMRAISSADSTDVPRDTDAVLRSSGWQLVSDATDNTHTYCLITGQGETSTVYEYVNNQDASAGLLTKGLACRGSSTIAASAGKPWAIDFSWVGNQPAPTDPTADGSAYTTAYSLDPDQEMLLDSSGGTWRLYDPAGAQLYGGGTLAAPSNDGGLVSLSLNTNRGEGPRRIAGSSGGIAGGFNAVNQPELTLVVECNDFTRVNLQQAKVNSTPLEFLVKCAQPGASGNTMTFLCYLTISTINPYDVGDGVLHCTLTCKLAYPPGSVSTNSPIAGVQPFSTATTATDRGLPLIPTATLPNALAFLQFATA